MENFNNSFQLFTKSVSFTPGVDFAKLYLPSEKMPAHGVWQKIRRLISPTFYLKNLRLKIPKNLPNAVCHSPVAIHQKRHRISPIEC
jgi:hypothetical protein